MVMAAMIYLRILHFESFCKCIRSDDNREDENDVDDDDDNYDDK